MGRGISFPLDLHHGVTPAHCLLLLHQQPKSSAQLSFHIPDGIRVPRAGDTLGFSTLVFHSFHHLQCRALHECELLDQVHIL